MAFLIPALGDRRADSPFPAVPTGGSFESALSGQSNFKDNDRYSMGLATEPIEGNSLTQYLRSLNNYSGLSGQTNLTTGGRMAGQSGDYWSRILSGNPSAIAQAMAPTINATNAAYKSAANTVDKFAPMGGGRSSTMANAPYAHAGAMSNIIAQAQPLAAQNLATLGTTEQSLGLQQLQQALASLLGMRGQDVTEHGQAMDMATALAGNLMGGVSSGINTAMQTGNAGFSNPRYV